MTKGNTSRFRIGLTAAGIAGLFALFAIVSGLWIHMSILAATVGLFFATVTLKKSRRPIPSPGTGAQVISLARYGLDSIEDLDEVA
jgi:hypothetical protein